MDLPINKARPLTMHIDLNSCFATIEQQANPLLRGKPIAVAAYNSPNGCILAPSIEAKRYGIKTGMRVKDAKLLFTDLIVRAPDAAKYRDVHKRFMKIFESYSPKVTAKSIDEAVIDFKNCENLNYDLVEIAKEIKLRMKSEIGEWMSSSIGISTNKLLAKLAASIRKPDGLLVIDHTNLIDIYKEIELMDFCGINVGYQARLNMNGIYTAMDFFNAPQQKLQKQVFRSIGGLYWYENLRGWEADHFEFQTKTIGHQYALSKPTNDKREIERLIMKLCEKVGRRMRAKGFRAKGVHLSLVFRGWNYWHKGKTFKNELYTTLDLFRKTKSILNKKETEGIVTKISVTAFDLIKNNFVQDDLFEESFEKKRKLAHATDKINDMFGEFTITPALMMDMEKQILDRIAFGRGGIN